jgi:phosphopantothenoylcysteine decarboxylase/phosphopantothenate--cysteine ligase
VLEPDEGEMACGEYGPDGCRAGRHPVGDRKSFGGNSRLSGKHIIVTAGPTQEPVDPSGSSPTAHREAGFAVAAALAELGARVTLVPDPSIWTRARIEASQR